MSARRVGGAVAAFALVLTGFTGLACRRSPANTPAASKPSLPPLSETAVNRFEVPVRESLRELQRAAEESLRAPVDRTAAADKLAALGAACVAFELYDHAEAALNLAESLAPADPRFPYYVGHLQERSGHREASVAAFRRALDRQGDFLPARIWLARALIDDGRAAEAEALLRPALDRWKNAPALHFELGRAAAAQGKDTLAREQLETVKRLAPAADEVNYSLGLVYRRLGMAERARELLEHRGKTKVPLDDPFAAELDRHVQGSRLHIRKGNESFARGDYPAAVDHFQAAVAAAPDDIDALRNLTAALFSAGKLDAALTRAREMSERYPEAPESWFQVATVLARLGRDAESIDPYRRCLALDASRDDARFNLANALRRLRRPAEAEIEYQKFAQHSPGSVAARLGLVVAKADQNRWLEARSTLEEAVRSQPNAVLQENLARLLAACPDASARDGRRALQIAEALMAKEKSVSHLETLAMALAENDQFPHAAAYQRMAIAASRAAHRQDLVAQLQPNLVLYERNLPCRTPFSVSSGVRRGTGQ